MDTLRSWPAGLVPHPGSKRKTVTQASTHEETKRSRILDYKRQPSFGQLSNINHSRMSGFESNPEEIASQNWEVYLGRIHLSKCSNNATSDIH